ncbi:bZIP_ATF6 domain-containing protein ATf6 isoform X2 [Rhodnius prolixus]|uniref:bZIP_ATF6 domain-containing protein ATf6 isoform X2 n=1 Tax=Rhodnius prolixus TaxID=13249 RepID=UPI003D1884C4
MLEDCILHIELRDMDCDIRNEDTFLNQFSEEFNGLLSEDDTLESKMCLDNNFFDSLLEEGNGCQWPDIFSQLDQLKDEECDIPIKLESLDNEQDSLAFTDSTVNGSGIDARNSPDSKYILETPPVSPPITDTPMCSFEAESTTRFLDSELMNDCVTTVQSNKSQVLRINPNNVKIIQNIKGLKPVGKQTQIVLPKEIIQKAIKFSTKGNISETSIGKTPAVNTRTNLGCNNSVIISTSQIGGSPRINDGNGKKLGQQNTSSSQNKPHILPLIKQESDILVKNELNIKALKRQQRMIKNRESACLSRKKKKEYVTSLESKISDLEHENNKLKMENDLLRSRIKELETGFRSHGKIPTLLNSNLRKTVAIFAVILMVSVNIGSISILSREGLRASEFKEKGEVVGNGVARRGRSLLWTKSEITSTYSNRSISSGSTKTYSTCPLYINQTESLRLEKELRQWIAVDEKRGGRYRNSTRKPAFHQTPIQQLILQNPKKLKTPNKTTRKTWSAVEIYHPPFPGSLPRREDTFYVFSFSSDHLLVPAVTHNNTLRPKMSFVIPTIPLNDSFINNGTVPMMQIDCEVLATRSIEFTEKDFKIFRPKEEVARKGNNSAQVSMRTNTYRPYFMQRRRVRPNSEFDDGFENYMNRIYRAANTFP